MKIDGFHHIQIVVKDYDTSMKFYVEGLGGKEVHSFPMGDSGKKISLVDLGNNAVIEIVPRGEGLEESNAHWGHIALRTDDARTLYDKAIKAGATPRNPPNDGNLGGNLPITNAFFLGPDKEVIELMQLR
ncbi:hypothetical protein FACS1894151_04770 [Spirochaetia bacterium]|nr:hypothetical protein FACS1894151_04770 [Spirochaetia bacterium]